MTGQLCRRPLIIILPNTKNKNKRFHQTLECPTNQPNNWKMRVPGIVQNVYVTKPFINTFVVYLFKLLGR
jgi:hypothetical protein